MKGGTGIAMAVSRPKFPRSRSKTVDSPPDPAADTPCDTIERSEHGNARREAFMSVERNFTKERLTAFLGAMASSGNVSMALAVSNVARATASTRRSTDQVFARGWLEAMEEATDASEGRGEAPRGRGRARTDRLRRQAG